MPWHPWSLIDPTLFNPVEGVRRRFFFFFLLQRCLKLGYIIIAGSDDDERSNANGGGYLGVDKQRTGKMALRDMVTNNQKNK